MLNSLQWRITAIVLGFALVLSTALMLGAGVILHRQLLDNLSGRAELAAAELQSQFGRLVRLGLAPTEIAGFEAQCRGVLQRDPVLQFVGVFDVFGRRLASAGSDRASWPLAAVDASAPVRGEDDSLVAARVVRKPGGDAVAYVVVTVSGELIRERLLRTLQVFIVVGLSILVFGLLLLRAVLRRMVTQPLDELVTAIEGVDPDAISVPRSFPPPGPDDLGRLAAAFSALLLRLADARQGMLAHNRKLEATVRERTRQLQEANQALAEDIERRKVLEQELRTLASTDALTGLANRAFVLPYLERRLKHAERHGRKLAVLLLDLDGFKGVNDGAGHAVGDHVLKAVAERLRAACRQSDVLARIGGDEFVLVQEGFEDEEQVAALARKLGALVARPVEVEGFTARLGLSAGAAIYPAHGDCVSTLLAAADAAMYQVKKGGGGFCIAA